MPDIHTVTTSDSWFGRIGKSISGIFFGIILLCIAVALLFWNEGRAVKRYKTLKEGEGLVVSIAANSVDAQNDDKLVHVSGEAAVTKELSDDDFAVAARALRLRRDVSMYQWEEKKESKTEKKLGGGEETVTTYTYSKKWSGSPIDSAGFQDPTGHMNPGEFPCESMTLDAEDATVGSFELSPQLVSMLGDFEKLPVREKREGSQWPEGAKLDKGGIYLGADPAKPQVGDVRIAFEIVPTGPVSIVARQSGSTFAPYQTKAGGDIEMIRSGKLDAKQMFAAAQSENTFLTWILRAVGFVLLWIGFSLILAPLSVLADVIPFLGNLVGAVTGMFSFFLALAVAAVVIAVAWLVFRPLLGIALLAIAVAALVFGFRLLRKKPVPAAA